MWYFDKREREKIFSIACKNETPFYVYHIESLRNEAKKYVLNFLNNGVKVFYAFKANSNKNICGELKKFGFGADVVSGGELRLALRVGFKDIFFSGVGKTQDELELAVRNRISFLNVESYEEFIKVREISNKMRILTNLSVRVNPDVDVETHGYIKTGKKYSKFGVDFKTAYDIYKKAKNDRFLKPVAIHFHLGSQIFSELYYEKALRRVVDFLESISHFITIDTINIGGGWGVKEGEYAYGHERLLGVVKPYMKRFKFIVEPGRSLVSSCGALIVRVIYRKKLSTNRYVVIVDGGMNNLIRPALYGAYHPILNLNERKGKKFFCDVAGPLCESSDYFVKNLKMVLPKQGDLILVASCGAYGRVMSMEYNLREKAREFFI